MRSFTFLICFLIVIAFSNCNSALCEMAIPPQVDLRPEFEKFGLPAVAQGNRDTCTTFADTALAEFESARHPRLSEGTQDDGQPGPGDDPKPSSEEFLIWAGNEASGIAGDQAMFWKSVHGLQTFGICPAELMPYKHVNNPIERPSREALRAARAHKNWVVHWIKRWNSTTGLTDREMMSIKEALAKGHPVATGLRWPKKEQLSADNVLNAPPTRGVFDGHSIAQVGYRDDPGQPGGGVFIFRNSNGPKWGENGYAYIPYAYVQRYCNDAIWLQPTQDFSDRTVVLEGEDLPVVATSRCTSSAQDMSEWGAKLWSHKKQLMCSCQRGGSVTLALPVGAKTGLEQGARYRVSVLLTMAPDFGKIRVHMDGTPIGREFDCYDPRVSPTGPVPLGVVSIEAPRCSFTISSVGKNEASSNFNFGIDAIQFVRLDEKRDAAKLP